MQALLKRQIRNSIFHFYMSEVSPTLVKQLREKTNAGMMDCKKALVESGGDLEKAEEILRKKGIAEQQSVVESLGMSGAGSSQTTVNIDSRHAPVVGQRDMRVRVQGNGS